MARSKRVDKKQVRKRFATPADKGLATHAKRLATPPKRLATPDKRLAAPAISFEPVMAPVASDAAALTSAPRIVLGDVLDQAAAGTLHAELLSHRGVDAVIDASAVRRIGGQCLQVLLSAAATWTHDGAALAVIDTSPEFIAGVQLLGIDPSDLVSRKPFAGAA
jgi:chemotaxis protein CheX